MWWRNPGIGDSLSAKPKTKSYAKLAQIEFCKGLDQRAAQIAAYRRVPLVEAYPEALRQIDREMKFELTERKA